jgi:hypothetical protein
MNIFPIICIISQPFRIPIIVDEIVEVVQINLILEFQQIDILITFICFLSVIHIFLFFNIAIELWIDYNSDLFLPLIILILLSCFVEFIIMILESRHQFVYMFLVSKTDQVDSLILVLNSILEFIRLKSLLLLKVQGVSTNYAVLDESLII